MMRVHRRIGPGVILVVGIPMLAGAQGVPSEVGAWSPTFNLWVNSAGCGTCATACNPATQTGCACDLDIAHAILISSGPRQGQVLFWRETTDVPQPSYVWDPGSATPPADFCVVDTSFTPPESGNLFCAGHSYSGDGRLVVGGG